MMRPAATMKPLSAAALFCCTFSLAAYAQVDTVRVTSSTVQQKTVLPGEILPYESVAIYARVNGYVEKVDVDRGSLVKKGQMLATLSAPELAAQVAEADSRIQVVASQQAEAEAKLVAAKSTFQRLKEASQTPGAVAGNELVLAEKQVDAAA